jgi:acyl-CoA thioester hydrolase
MFQKKLYAGWGDMDFNSHMKNTAFLDKSGDIRMMYFAENGFSMSEFARLMIGPVVMKDELEYFKEVQLMEEILVDVSLAGLAEDGSRFSIRNTFKRASDERLVAIMTSTGGWLDREKRKLVAPPPALLEVLKRTDRTTDFKTYPSSVR